MKRTFVFIITTLVVASLVNSVFGALQSAKRASSEHDTDRRTVIASYEITKIVIDATIGLAEWARNRNQNTYQEKGDV